MMQKLRNFFLGENQYKVQQEFTNNYPLGAPDYDPILSFAYTGEQTPGAISPTKHYVPDYQRLRAKNWQLYYDSDIAQIVINNDLNWVLGSGLNLKSEPKVDLLKRLGIEIKKEEFSKELEELFSVVKKSRYASHDKNMTLDQLIKDARLTKLVGGDVLYVLRYEGDTVTMQVIDGINIVTPCDNEEIKAIKARGNRIVHGVELDSNGTHIAYHVRVINPTEENAVSAIVSQLKFKTIRIQARLESGQLMAVMGYGCRYRIDEVRGMGVLSGTIETVTTMDRYRKATLDNAEERAKIPYAFEHGTGSTGENPLDQKIAQAEALGMQIAPNAMPQVNTGYALDSGYANRVAMVTNKTILNLPIDAKVKSLESKNDLYFKDFFETNFGIFCAQMQQPPEVALMAFNSNFSASRMAGKMWEYNVSVRRNDEGLDSYKPFCTLLIEVYLRKGILPFRKEYLTAIEKGWIAKEAFESMRFVGMPIPHVDPVKEVTAERLKLGKAFDDMPLTSPSDSAERLALGDLEGNIEEYERDYKRALAVMNLRAQGAKEDG